MHMRRVPGAQPNRKVILMKKFALHKTLMLIAALAIGSAGDTGADRLQLERPAPAPAPLATDQRGP